MAKVIAATVVAASAQTAAVDPAWEQFKQDFGRTYNGDEEESRHAIFTANLELIEAENAKGHSYQLGVGPFADMTNDEFKSLNGYIKPEIEAPVVATHQWEGEELAASLDWVSKGGVVTPVKNQGQCGSCWAFSTTGALEGGFALADGNLVSLSEQQYVDCDGSPNMGCNGGLMQYALAWAKSNDICTEDSYPYQAVDGSCKSSSCTVGLPSGKVTGVTSVGSSDSDLMSAVNKMPVSIAIEADQSVFQHYSSGVMTGNCGANTDHGVLLVGYGTESGNDYWKVKNSWGASWGDSGYVKMVRGRNQCGINTGPNYPVFGNSEVSV